MRLKLFGIFWLYALNAAVKFILFPVNIIPGLNARYDKLITSRIDKLYRQVVFAHMTKIAKKGIELKQSDPERFEREKKAFLDEQKRLNDIKRAKNNGKG